MNTKNIIINSIIFGVLLNLILPLLLEPFATVEEKKPPKGAENLSYKGQFMHMMVHHNQVQLIGALIIAIIIGLSVYLGTTFKLAKHVL
jgi:hypothetical protein